MRSQHLEDKVFSDGHRNVMNQPKVEQFSTEQSNTEEEIAANKVETGTNLKIKMKICRPHYLKDFVTNAILNAELVASHWVKEIPLSARISSPLPFFYFLSCSLGHGEEIE